jgi:hypothetical protein
MTSANSGCCNNAKKKHRIEGKKKLVNRAEKPSCSLGRYIKAFSVAITKHLKLGTV